MSAEGDLVFQAFLLPSVLLLTALCESRDGFAVATVSGSFLWLEVVSDLLIFVSRPEIVVPCLYLGIFSAEGVVHLEAAEKYTFVFLLQLS